MIRSDELIIDSFAGGGGASTGIEMALGRSPDYAINHDAEALALHAANHPATVHLSKNIWKIDPLDVVGRRPVGLLWASPDCKHFSKAKGGKPVKRNIRDLAWIVVLWAERARPRVICLENVEEFQDWGPLIVRSDGSECPCPDRKGETFKRFVRKLRALGYRVDWRELRACDYGAPTIRKRLFLIARCDGEPICWPEPTHGDPRKPGFAESGLLPWRTAAECIDFTLPCPSIFLTREEGRAIGVNRPLAEATMARIARGVKRYVIDAAKPFIVRVDQASSASRAGVHPVDDPLRTVATAGGLAVVSPFVAPVTHAGDLRVNSADEPLRTITTSQRGEHALVSPFMVPRYGERPGQDPRTRSVKEPMPVVVPTGNGAGLISPVLAGCGGRAAQSPPKSVDQPMNTTAAKADQVLVAAHLTKFSENSIGTMPDEPLHTAMAGAPRHGVVAAFLAQHNTGLVGHEAREPVSTLVQKGCTQAVVSAGLVNLKGSDRRMSGPVDPHPTVTSQGFHQAEVRAFLIKYYGIGPDGHDLAAPCGTVTAKDRFGLVMVEGEPYEIVDIGMRMLTPRELYLAQGFPPEYRIDIEIDGRRLSKASQTRMCGNSVCPPIAAAIVRANLGQVVEEQGVAVA
ncbi:MAG: DNA cytosine methyltransferase [Bradyrhizobium sp.]|uniref:DNA cytosine methyltransferase n=1 Tax=Bradyrhizobium sp. TaxID=376 RepID=UPI003D10572D